MGLASLLLSLAWLERVSEGQSNQRLTDFSPLNGDYFQAIEFRKFFIANNGPFKGLIQLISSELSLTSVGR